MKKFKLVPAALGLGIVIINPTFVMAAGKITLSPAYTSLNEGQSQNISIQLDNQIIATPPGNYVTLSITSSNPETVQINPSSITYAAHEWSQIKTFTVQVPHNGTYGDSRNVLIMARATSGSQYYNGNAGGATLQIADMTAQPGTSPPQDPVEPPEDTQVDETPMAGSEDVDVSEDKTRTGGSPAPAINNEIALSTSKPAEANRSVLSPLGEFNDTNAGRLKDMLIPGKRPLQQTLLVYSMITILASLLAATLLYVKRRTWWRRQEARDVRWYYRHASKKPINKPAKKSKRNTRIAKRR